MNLGLFPINKVIENQSDYESNKNADADDSQPPDKHIEKPIVVFEFFEYFIEHCINNSTATNRPFLFLLLATNWD